MAHYARAGLLLAATASVVQSAGAVSSDETEPAGPRNYVGGVLRNVGVMLVGEFGILDDVGVVLVLLVITVLAVYIIPPVFERILRRVQTPAHVRTITRTVLHIAIGYLGLRLALGAIGVDADALVLSFGLVGVALSIGAASAIANVIAGLVHTNEEMQPGGRVSIHSFTGVVEEHGFFNVRIRDDETGWIVVVPNKDFIDYPWRAIIPDKTAGMSSSDDDDDSSTVAALASVKSKNR